MLYRVPTPKLLRCNGRSAPYPTALRSGAAVVLPTRGRVARQKSPYGNQVAESIG